MSREELIKIANEIKNKNNSSDPLKCALEFREYIKSNGFDWKQVNKVMTEHLKELQKDESYNEYTIRTVIVTHGQIVRWILCIILLTILIITISK